MRRHHRHRRVDALDSMICEPSCAKKSSESPDNSSAAAARMGRGVDCARQKDQEGQLHDLRRPPRESRLFRAARTGSRLPVILLVDHRKGIPVWGNEQPLERNQWADRAVLTVEALDRGSRALEQNLRSFTDDDLLHHMKRQAMVAGTTLESMQV